MKQWPVDCIWQLAINAAVTEKHLVTLAAGFIAGWTAEELAHIPESCRPTRLRSPREVQRMLERLEQAYDGCAFFAEDQPYVERLLGFLEAIAERMVEIGEAGRAANRTIAQARWPHRPSSSFEPRRL